MADSGKTSLGQPMLPPMYEFRPPTYGGRPTMWVNVSEMGESIKFPTLRFPHAEEDPDSDATLWLRRNDEFHALAQRIDGWVCLVTDAPVEVKIHPDLGAVVNEDNPQLQSGDSFWMLMGHDLPQGWGNQGKK